MKSFVQLRREIIEYQEINRMLAKLLQETAHALKGQKGDPPTMLYDWSDLPEVAKALREKVGE